MEKKKSWFSGYTFLIILWVLFIIFIFSLFIFEAINVAMISGMIIFIILASWSLNYGVE